MKGKAVTDNSVPLLEKPERPKILGGITIKVVTGCGSMYVQLNWYHGCLFEVFATHGHGGGCAACEMEALTKSITLGLKCGVSVANYIDQLKGINCPNPMPFPKEDAVLSCPDGIAKVLERYGTLSIDKVVELIQGMNGGAVSPEDEMAEAKAKHEELAAEREKLELNT